MVMTQRTPEKEKKDTSNVPHEASRKKKLTHAFGLNEMTFLVVDKDRRPAALIRTILRNLSAKEVHYANHYEQAIHILETTRIDMVISELVFGEDNRMGGITLAKGIRGASFEDYQRVPIIMATSATAEINIHAARDAGVNEVMAKPMTPLSVYKHISAVIAKPRDFIEVPLYIGPDRRRKVEFFETERRTQQ
ncbi:hypothetical protein MTBPR1_190010 [Candidatus Terasakiella magnetica]|uniref:Response regulatory domain-containing protein n=1 Tax=Candidatus Terasakiella magnetica TaxID=1867952 RepID=A0A1C3RFY9_9PROT|nr:response regulator [Candidatus Terasakiella magnetica]SCA56132.1 hypothetical protein MTBPR1_190010 [Candidatus Terasakiella magnetica]